MDECDKTDTANCCLHDMGINIYVGIYCVIFTIFHHEGQKLLSIIHKYLSLLIRKMRAGEQRTGRKGQSPVVQGFEKQWGGRGQWSQGSTGRAGVADMRLLTSTSNGRDPLAEVFETDHAEPTGV